MKLLIDMNLSPRWTGYLEQHGVEAAHWGDVGAGDSTDREIMEYAREHGYAVLTHDLDFGAILAATGGEKPSVVQIRSDDLSTGSIGAQVVAALRQWTEELDAGALVTIDPVQLRVRILPILRRREEF